MLALKALSLIQSADLEALCFEKTPESRHLEFKRELPGSKDKDRFEFAKDVAAFANAEGGDIVYGIEEQDGAAARILPLKDCDQDSARIRLMQILDASLEPRLDHLEIQPIPIGDGFILVVRVPPTNLGPFRVVQNHNSRFVVRELNYVRDMTFSEIRSAFAAEKNFRAIVEAEQRRAIDTIIEGATWRPLQKGPALAFQVVPYAAASGRLRIDPASAFENHNYMMLPNWGGCSRALNLDGLVFYAGSNDELYAYNLAHRSGVFEAFSFSGYSFSDQPIIPALSLAQTVREAAHEFVKHYKRLQIGGPAAMALSLVGAKGRKLEMGSRYFREAPLGDRDVMPIPPIYVESILDDEKLDPAIKSLLDITWQAFGVSSCPYFDEHGVWQNPR